MAITRDAVTTKDYNTTKSWTHTCGSGAKFLAVFIRDDAGGISAVTYDGVAMVQLPGSPHTVGGFDHYVFTLSDPHTGANTLAVTTSSSNIGASSVSYNAAGSASVDGTNGANDSGAGTLAVTTTVDSDWTVVCVADRTGSSPTASTGSTVVSQPGSGASMTYFDSNGSVGAAGSHSMNWSSGTAAVLMFGIKDLPLPISWKPDFPDIILDQSFETVDSGMTPRPPADPTDPTPN